MNSPDDIAELGRVFGFAPQEMLRVDGLPPGEALLAGGFAPVPMRATMRERLTHEGGSDVAVPVVTPGSSPGPPELPDLPELPDFVCGRVASPRVSPHLHRRSRGRQPEYGVTASASARPRRQGGVGA